MKHLNHKWTSHLLHLAGYHLELLIEIFKKKPLAQCISCIRVTVNVIKKCNLIKVLTNMNQTLWVVAYESLKTKEKTSW